MSDLDELLGETSAMLLRCKAAIRTRFAALNLTEAEVQGLVVVAFEVSPWAEQGAIHVATTVKRWRRQGRVDEEWRVKEARRAAQTVDPGAVFRQATDGKRFRAARPRPEGVYQPVDDPLLFAAAPALRGPQVVRATDTTWNWWQKSG